MANTYEYKQHDNWPPIEVDFADVDGAPVDITAYTITFKARKTEGTTLLINRAMTKTDATHATLTPTSQETVDAGTWKVEYEFTDGGGHVFTVPVNGYDELVINDDLDVP